MHADVPQAPGRRKYLLGGGCHLCLGKNKISPGISGHGIHTAEVDSSCMTAVPLPRLLAHAHWWDLLFWHCYRQVLRLSHQGRRHDNRQRYATTPHPPTSQLAATQAPRYTVLRCQTGIRREFLPGVNWETNSLLRKETAKRRDLFRRIYPQSLPIKKDF